MNALTALLGSATAKARIAAVSGALLLAALAAWAMGSPTVQDIALIAASVVAGVPIALSAVQALRYKAFSIDLLVTIAVVGALVIGEYVESGVVAFLFVFGSYLEARTLAKTRESIRELTEMAPRTATVLRDGETVTVDVDDVDEGETVVIRTGDTVPVDGTVVSGSGHLDEATITGESVPVERTEGDQVFSGTLLDNGYLQVRADQVGDDTTFARIIEMVEDAQDSSSSAQRFLDRFAKWYTPAIIVASVLVFAFTRDAHFALTFLVISCPGALVISTPVSMVAGLGNGARHGVLLKGGDAMERLSTVSAVVVDKTGTLTHGHPEVTAVRTRPGVEETEMLALAASLETASEHPLGAAVVRDARTRGLALTDPTEVEVHRGAGISGLVDGTWVGVGSRRMLPEEGLAADVMDTVEAHERDGATVFFVLAGPQAMSAEVIGLIAVADTVREGVAESIAQLHGAGIEKVVMLTGDNRRTAQAVATRLGIDEVRAELMPQDKVTAVQELQEQGLKVAMIGDGVNDAPAIATADLGIAMGTGTDVSIETADVVLAGGRFDQLVHARRLSKATVANMLQNTVIALATVAGLLLGVLAGKVFMAAGMLIHELSVLVVILNAVRLVRFGRRGRAQADAEHAARGVLDPRQGVGSSSAMD